MALWNWPKNTNRNAFQNIIIVIKKKKKNDNNNNDSMSRSSDFAAKTN